MENLQQESTNNNLENIRLFNNLKEALKNYETLVAVERDFATTFERLGEDNEIKAIDFSNNVISKIQNSNSLEESEKEIKNYFDTNLINGETVFKKIENGLEGRRELIFTQLKPYLENAKGKVIDYGAGSGQITQLLYDRLGLEIEGVDVRDFKGKEVTVPMKVFDGYKVPVEDLNYTTAVLTNVIHHEKDNEKILAELSRIVKNKLVIIETVPEADDEVEAKKDWGRMLLNDTLWNRYFNYANIPVPGTYETPQNWIKRFEKYGWKVTHSEDLGFDQPTIQDRHHLLVFER